MNSRSSLFIQRGWGVARDEDVLRKTTAGCDKLDERWEEGKLGANTERLDEKEKLDM